MVRSHSLLPVKRLSVLLLTFLTLLYCGFLAGRAFADQPHMHAALDHLRAAKQQLETAEANKGGHREKAIRLVNDAIVQVEKGIAYERAH
jgi:hypothetical protein